MVTAKKRAFYVALLYGCFLVNHACDHDGVRFGYSGRTGPKYWGTLSPNFTLCSKGINQSPIDIVKDEAVYNPQLEPLERDYTATNATIVDNVFNIAVCSEPISYCCCVHRQNILATVGSSLLWECIILVLWSMTMSISGIHLFCMSFPFTYIRDNYNFRTTMDVLRYNDTSETVKVGGIKYNLKQLHWHSPSEHTMNGQRFAMELHMVHFTEDGNITVVAILYRYGKPDPFLFQIKDQLAELHAEGCKAEKGDPLPVGVVDMTELKQGADRYYRYVGSLSAPPCTENVIWNVLAEVREMTKEQAADLMAPLEGSYRHNSRPLQPLNGRVVQVYDRSLKIRKMM